jgi:SAM-dependent methyltransferase
MSRIISDLLKDKRGIEIGRGNWNDYGLDALNVDIKDRELWQGESKKRSMEPTPIDIESDAGDIPVLDNSQDFVFSSHVFEHLPDPMRVMVEWYRIIRPGGIACTVIPKSTASPDDVGRPLTTLYEIIDRFHRPGEYEQGKPYEHKTIWDIKLFREFIEYGNKIFLWQFKEIVCYPTDDQVGNGFIVAFKKVG